MGPFFIDIDTCAPPSPEKEAVLDALLAVIEGPAMGREVDEILNCFVTVMMAAAFSSGMPAEAFRDFLHQAAQGSDAWWRAAEQTQMPFGSA